MVVPCWELGERENSVSPALGSMAGAIGGMLMSQYAGHVLDTTGSYTSIFVAIGFTYVVALAIVHLLTPRLDPVILPAQPQ